MKKIAEGTTSAIPRRLSSCLSVLVRKNFEGGAPAARAVWVSLMTSVSRAAATKMRSHRSGASPLQLSGGVDIECRGGLGGSAPHPSRSRVPPRQSSHCSAAFRPGALPKLRSFPARFQDPIVGRPRPTPETPFMPIGLLTSAFRSFNRPTRIIQSLRYSAAATRSPRSSILSAISSALSITSSPSMSCSSVMQSGGAIAIMFGRMKA